MALRPSRILFIFLGATGSWYGRNDQEGLLVEIELKEGAVGPWRKFLGVMRGSE